MTKLISALIIVVVIYCGWQLFQYWEKIDNEEATKRREAAAQLNPATLPGVPQELEQSYQNAQQQGVTAMRNWLKNHDKVLQDPRKAWIELDFCVAITRDDPAEARRIFKAVKDRTPQNSPIQPRLKQLESSYQ
jgi:hypothetical protein